MRKYSLSLIHKTILAVAIVLVPIVGAFTYHHFAMKDAWEQLIFEDLRIMADAFEGEVYQFLEMSKRRVQDFASDGFIRDKLQEINSGQTSSVAELCDHLKYNKKPLDLGLYDIFIISPTGIVLATSQHKIQGRNIGNEPFFVAGQHQITITEFPKIMCQDCPALVASGPIYDRKSGEFLGVIANLIPFAELTKVLVGDSQKGLGAISWHIGQQRTLEAYLVNRNRLMMTASKFIPNAVFRQKVDTLPVHEALQNGKEIVAFYQNYRGLEVIGASMWIPSLQWICVVEIEKNEVLSPIMNMRWSALAILVVVVVLIVVNFIIFFLDVILRLRKLSQATEAIAQGKYDIVLPVDSQDEIGALSRLFNKMAAEIGQKTIALQKSEGQLRSVIGNSQALIYVKDLQGRFILVNQRFLDFFHLELDQVLGKTDYDLFSQQTADACRVNDVKILETNASLTFEEVVPIGNGFNHYISAKFPLRNQEGKIYATGGISTDITYVKTMESQLRQASKMEAVGRLAGGIAHDFNNILSAIMGYTELVQIKMLEDDPLRGDMDNILIAAQRAAQLTKSLLAFSRKQVLNPKPVNLNKIVQEGRKLVNRLIPENIEVVVNLADQDLVIMADATQIEQVFLNLCANARDAMPTGGKLMIQTSETAIDEKFVAVHGYGKVGKYALLTLTDTGIGMDKKTLERLFEPFFTTKELGKGTGLGLSIVYGIIKQQEGYINAYSEPGQGTIFRIYLPLIAEPAVQETKKEIATAIKTGQENILLVEDDSLVRAVTKKLLQEFGYNVMEASDGEDGIQKFREHAAQIPLLILDVIMPKKNGREVYEEAKQLRPAVKVIFVSGYPANILAGHGISEQSEFLYKPVSPNALLRKVREVLDRKE